MKEKLYGYELILDLYDCDPKIISSKKKLKEYVDNLCKIIKMKKYGKTYLPHFGHKRNHTKGYSLLQFIETSSITAHFSELWNSAYINIFSCKYYDPDTATKFTKKFFRAKRIKKRYIIRK